MSDFVAPTSIVRTIWSDADTILLIFAGSAAEFAVNRAVDWLFFTGKLPRDPIGRFFATVRYAQDIVFADEQAAHQALARINAIHGAVERQRGEHLPDWANRDVLYMLIDYSERAYRLLHRPLTPAEQQELFDVFRRVGEGLHVLDLPSTYVAWQPDRQRHIARDLVRSQYTLALYRRYREELGWWRYLIMLETQRQLLPPAVRRVLGMPRSFTAPSTALYQLIRRAGLRPLLQRSLVPRAHLAAVQALERPYASFS